MSKSEELNILFEIWKNKDIKGEINHKDKFIQDGIVDEKKWLECEKKILFILKEAYDKTGEGYDLTKWLREEAPRKRPWGRIARLIYGISNSSDRYIEKYKYKLTDEEHREMLGSIAVMNIKKSSGNSESNYENIEKYAEYDSSELRKEFEIIDPDIIICGNTFAIFRKTILKIEDMNFEKNENWYYWIKIGDRKRLFIDYYHVSNRWPELMNYYGLMGIYNQALRDDKNIFDCTVNESD